MKKNFIAKIMLGVLLCSSMLPVAASTHSRTLKLDRTNAALQPHQQVTDMGYRAKHKNDEEIAISLRKMEGTSRIDFRVLDANTNVIKDWKNADRFAGWDNITLHPVAGTTIERGSLIDIQLRDHYDRKKTSYIVDGELDYK